MYKEIRFLKKKFLKIDRSLILLSTKKYKKNY